VAVAVAVVVFLERQADMDRHNGPEIVFVVAVVHKHILHIQPDCLSPKIHAHLVVRPNSGHTAT
jgi:hypothetical protein